MGKAKETHREKVNRTSPAKQARWTPRIEITPATHNQQDYWSCLEYNAGEYSDIIVGHGSAGTGKTWLAAARACQMYLAKEISTIIIVRPMVETGGGNKLGALPGQLDEKYDPWVDNVRGMLEEFLGKGKVENDWGSGILAEPLAFCRGKTFDSSFIILDEGQNATWEEIKMMVTRVGRWSKMVIAGDTEQCDLPSKFGESGLKKYIREVIRQNANVDIIKFTPDDNQRSGISRDMTILCDNAE